MHQDERPRVRGDLSGRLRRPLLEGVHDRRRRQIAPAVETLEGRRLLSTYTGPSAHRPVSTPAGLFQIQVSGPGAVEVQHTAGGAINLNV